MSASIHSISVLRKHSHNVSDDENLVVADGGDAEGRPRPPSLLVNDTEMETVSRDPHDAPNQCNPLLGHAAFYSPAHVERMRRRLRFFFMNPIDKWVAGRFPWKLSVQIFKIIVVTLQVALFGNARYTHISFYNDNSISLSHLFLRNWEDTRDVKAYPPALGLYAVYTKSDLYASLDHAVITYANLPRIAIGSYDHANPDGSLPSLTLCKTYYKTGDIFGFNQSYSFDNTIIEDCLEIFPLSNFNGSFWGSFDSEEYFKKNNFSFNFDRFIKAELKFAVKGVLLKSLRPMDRPDCYTFNITILYDNSNHNGQIHISLHINELQLPCQGTFQNGESDSVKATLLDCLNAVVIMVSSLSLALCSRAIYRAQKLKKVAMKFFENHFGKKLSMNEQLEFLNFWYVLIIINDILVIFGSIIKIQIENKITHEDLYNACSVLLGIGTLLVWFGVLRYLSFFSKYNILILTVRRAAPDVLRFLFCAILIYAGFVFNGWIILGPYHIKFQTLSTTSECLFSLINGDDMFATFAITLDKSNLIWWYSRIYFYSFTSLFIYVVISLFIAVIMDSYDTIKSYYLHGFPKTFLMEFVSECVDNADSGVFKDDEEVQSWKDWLAELQLCSLCRKRNHLEHYEPL